MLDDPDTELWNLPQKMSTFEEDDDSESSDEEDKELKENKNPNEFEELKGIGNQESSSEYSDDSDEFVHKWLTEVLLTP